MYIQRYIEKDIVKSLKNFPVVAVTGPRQCGKSTLVNELGNRYTMDRYFSAGGFPRSILAKDEDLSFEWRENARSVRKVTDFVDRH